MTSFMFRKTHGPAHYRFDVFVGPDREHRALSGELVMQPHEAVAFSRLLEVFLNMPLAENAVTQTFTPTESMLEIDIA